MLHLILKKIIFEIWGCIGFDLEQKLKMHVEVDRTAS